MNARLRRTILLPALLLACISLSLSLPGCSRPQDALPENEPSDLAQATPAAAASYGAEVSWAAPGESLALAGASSRSRWSYYDSLTLRVNNAALLDYDEFILSHPGYAEEGWDDRGDMFLMIDVVVSNESNSPVKFDVEDLTIYSETVKLYDASPYWERILDIALAEHYGSLETWKGDKGGSWGYPDGWNVIDGNGEKEFSLPFRLYPGIVEEGSLEHIAVDDFYLQVYAACSQADIVRGVQPTNCYLFALSEKGGRP